MFSPIGLIGLGGTGKLAALHLKRALIERFGDADLPAVRCLVIDTDPSVPPVRGSKGLVSLADDELYVLETGAIPNLQVNTANMAAQHKGRAEWWPGPRLDAPLFSAAGNGAGMTGSFGRLIYHEACAAGVGGSPETALKRLADQLLDPNLATVCVNYFRKKDLAFKGLDLRPTVFVVGSLCGGTGRGTFLDVAITLRQWLPVATPPAPPRDIFGVLFTASLFEDHPEIKKAGQAGRVRANCAAALAELEYFQRISQAEYSVNYSEHERRSWGGTYPLFTHVFLVGSANGSFILKQGDDGLHDAARLVAEFALALPSDFSDGFKARISNPTGAAPGDDVNIGGAVRRRARYSAFGVHSISLPHLADACDALALDWLGGILRELAVGQVDEGQKGRLEELSNGASSLRVRAWKQQWASIADVTELAQQDALDLNTLKAALHSDKPAAEGHLEKIQSFDQRLNGSGPAPDWIRRNVEEETRALWDTLSGANASLTQLPLGLASWKVALDAVTYWLGEQVSGLERLVTDLSDHVRREEKRLATAIEEAAHFTAGAVESPRQVYRAMAEAALKLSPVWVLPFDLDADKYAGAVKEAFLGLKNKTFLFADGSAGGLKVDTPGWNDVAKAKAFLARYRACHQLATDLLNRVTAAATNCEAGLQWLGSEEARTKYDRVDTNLYPSGGYVLPRNWLGRKLLKRETDGRTLIYWRPSLVTNLATALRDPGANAETVRDALERALGALSGDVRNDNVTTYRDLSPVDPGASSETGVATGDTETRSEVWLAVDRTFVSGRITEIALSGGTGPGFGSVLTYRPTPTVAALKVWQGIFASQITHLVDWIKGSDINHLSSIDRRVQDRMRDVDLTDGRLVVCLGCGRDYTAEMRRAQQGGQPFDRAKVLCPCGYYLDGSWRCRGGAPHGPHAEAPYPKAVNQCTTQILKPSGGGGMEMCGQYRPGYAPPRYCPGCRRSAQLRPGDKVPPGAAYQIRPGDKGCPSGHVTRVGCPECGRPDNLGTTVMQDPGRANRVFPVHTCGDPACLGKTQGRPWPVCPNCEFPQAIPQAVAGYVAQATCPSCGITLFECKKCPPSSPFRLVDQPENPPGYPDLNQKPACPVHGVLT